MKPYATLTILLAWLTMTEALHFKISLRSVDSC